MIEIGLRAAIHRPLRLRPGLGWGTRSWVGSTVQPLYLVVTTYSTLASSASLHLGSILYLVVTSAGETLYIVPQYVVSDAIIPPLSIVSCPPLPCSPTTSSTSLSQRYILCFTSTTYTTSCHTTSRISLSI